MIGLSPLPVSIHRHPREWISHCCDVTRTRCLTRRRGATSRAGRHSTIFTAGRLRRCATRSPRATALAACALIGAMRRAKLIAMVADATGVVVSGESGVGKSALALLSFTAAGAADLDTVQALCINLRQIPKLTVEFEAMLDCSLSTLLCELAAPQRILIVDGADAVAEGMDNALRYLVDAAQEKRREGDCRLRRRQQAARARHSHRPFRRRCHGVCRGPVDRH